MNFGANGQEQSFGAYPGALSPSTSGSYFYGGGGAPTAGGGQPQQQPQSSYPQSNQPSLQPSTSYGSYPGMTTHTSSSGSNSHNNSNLQSPAFGGGGQQHQQQSQYQHQEQPSLGGAGPSTSGSFFYPGANNTKPEQALQQEVSGSYFYSDSQLAQQQSQSNYGSPASLATPSSTTSQGANHNKNISSGSPAAFGGAAASSPLVGQPLPNQLNNVPRDGDVFELVPNFDTSKRVQATVDTHQSGGGSSSSSALSVDGSRPVYISIGEYRGDYSQRFRCTLAIDGYVGSSSLEPLAAPNRAIAVATTTHLILADKNDKSGTISFWLRPAGIPGVFMIQPAAVSGQNVSVSSQPGDSSKLQLSLAQANPRDQFQQFRFVKANATIKDVSDVSHNASHVIHKNESATYSFTASPSQAEYSSGPTNNNLPGVPSGAPQPPQQRQQQQQQQRQPQVQRASAHLLDDSSSSAPNHPNTQIQGSVDAPPNPYRGPANRGAAPTGALQLNPNAAQNQNQAPTGPQPIQGRGNNNNTRTRSPTTTAAAHSVITPANLFVPHSAPSTKEPTPKTSTGSSSNDKDDSENMCVVCLTEKKSHLFLPCRHLCVCETCAKHFKKSSPCPVCRTKAESIIKIFA